MNRSINKFYRFLIDIFLSFIYLFTINQIRFKYMPMLQVIGYDLFIGFYVLFHYKSALKLLFPVLKYNHKTCKTILLLYLVICFFGLFSPLVHFTYDTSYFFSVIINGLFINTLKIFFLILITYRIKKNMNNLLIDFIKYNIGALFICIFSTVLFVFLPSFKAFWRSILFEDDLTQKRLSVLKYITRFSIIGYTGYIMTFRATLFSIINLIIIDFKKKVKESCLPNYFITIILLFGNLFYGRVGLMFTLISIFIYIIYDIVINKRIKLLINISILFITIFTGLAFFKNTNSEFRRWYDWAMAPVESFIKHGKIGTSSSDKMFEKMLFWPGIETFLFGDGYWKDPNGTGYYKHTDLGIMRPMLYYGIFAQILGYTMPLLFLFGIFKMGKQWRLLAFLLSFQMFFFELKGDSFDCIATNAFGIWICLWLRINNGNIDYRFIITENKTLDM